MSMDKQLNLIGNWVDCIDKATSRRTSYTSHILDQLLWDSRCTLGLLLGCYWVVLGFLMPHAFGYQQTERKVLVYHNIGKMKSKWVVHKILNALTKGK